MHPFARSLFVVLPLLATAAQAEAVAVPEKPYTALRPGLWEVKTSTRMQGMPYELPPVPYTATQCLTQDLLNNQENLAKVTATRGDCDIHDVNVSDERTSWSMDCSQQNGIHIDGQGYIAPITREMYTGKVNFTLHNPSIQAMRGEVNVQGAWQGECTGNDAENHARPSYRTPVYTPE